MKIGIIGAGNVGRTLGEKWAAAGHEILFGVRNPLDPKYQHVEGFGVVSAVGTAVALGEVVVLALPGKEVAGFLSKHGLALRGKTILDATNTPSAAEMNSLELIAEKAPDAHLVRAFNTLGWENFANPEIQGEQIDLFFCGQAGTRALAEELIAAVGLRPVYVGDLNLAGALDGLTRIWFALAIEQGFGRHTALKLLRET